MATSPNAIGNYFSPLIFIYDHFNIEFSIVLKICDEFDKAIKIYDYLLKTLTNHIKTSIMPAFEGKEGENLLKVYIKEWKDYILLAHFMKKVFFYIVCKKKYHF